MLGACSGLVHRVWAICSTDLPPREFFFPPFFTDLPQPYHSGVPSIFPLKPQYQQLVRYHTYTESAAGKTNIHRKRRKASSRTVCLIKANVIEFRNEATWSTRRAECAPGTPFTWATCDETKVAALLRSRHQNDGRGWRRPEGGCRKFGERGQFLFCCSLQPSFQQSFERDS